MSQSQASGKREEGMPGGGHSKYKGLEWGRHLACSRTHTETQVGR